MLGWNRVVINLQGAEQGGNKLSYSLLAISGILCAWGIAHATRSRPRARACIKII